MLTRILRGFDKTDGAISLLEYRVRGSSGEFLCLLITLVRMLDSQLHSYGSEEFASSSNYFDEIDLFLLSRINTYQQADSSSKSF